MTFSIVARDDKTGQFAVCVCSSSPAVGARCAFARAGAGAVTSQNVTDPRLGPQALDLLERGATAHETRNHVIESCEYSEFRQLTCVDKHGSAAIWSGSRALGISSQAEAANVASAGNLLKSPKIPHVIVDTFSSSNHSTSLGQRVLDAMKAGLEAGGEAGPVRSAALIVADKAPWPLADLRVDWTTDNEPNPIEKLQQLWNVWEPQMHDYVERCYNPMYAPSYGVPGDD